MNKIITIVVVVLVALGLGFFLFKISPEQANQAASSNYQINTDNIKPISEVPAFNAAVDHFQGSASAKNVFVEYGDYQCPACAAYSELLKQVPSVFKDTVFVFRYFPLTQIHKNAVESALAAEAAGAQGKYWEMHDLLFSKQTEWEGLSDPLDKFAEYAQQLGVADLTQFKNDITSKKYIGPIQTNSDQALGLNIPGTPTFFFNGHALKNDQVPAMEKEAQQYYIK